jgi:glycosyltransferase involved in cell wall biosynthesis
MMGLACPVAFANEMHASSHPPPSWAEPAVTAPRVAPQPVRRGDGRPVRVTHIVFDLEGGGLETLVANMAAHWAGTDIVMSVITLSGRVGRVGASVRRLVDQFHVISPRRGWSMLHPKALGAAIRATRPDVAHLHTGAWFKGARAARMAHIPRVLYTEHGREHHDPLLARWQDRVASGWTDHVVAVSDRLRHYMIDTVGVSAGRVMTIANGVDTERFRPGRGPRLRRALGLSDDTLVIGSVGRLEPVKAFPELVAAFARVRRAVARRPLALVLFGDGVDRATIARAAVDAGVAAHVHLPGWIDSADDAYRCMDIFAMTSTSEGMSVSLMEAMACGVCPVVTDVGANADVVGPELRHHVVPCGARPALSSLIARLVEDDGARRAASERARAEAVARFRVAATFHAYERLYRGRADARTGTVTT